LNVASNSQPPSGKIVDGETLMRDGVPVPCRKEFDSAIIEFSDAK
jgi:hypothetical protein